MSDDTKDTSPPRFWMVWRAGGSAPTRCHTSRQIAEDEAGRLAKKHPGARFFVLKAVCAIEAEYPAIARIELRKREADDDIPF
jgi:hypothetical protein